MLQLLDGTYTSQPDGALYEVLVVVTLLRHTPSYFFEPDGQIEGTGTCDAKPVYVQSTGQLCVLQVRVSVLCGHALPPLRGCVIERERFCEPPPHDLVHVVQALKALTVQWIGHRTCVLHGAVSAVCGQSAPPYFGGVTRREREYTLDEVPPQDTGHVLHELQALTTQSIGHCRPNAHVRYSDPCGQATPPKAG